ncbi:AEC family transporter [Oxalobacteraceae bacterium CAVE-383]|nr:AEC family transporter [Oxalobacteraceae bacterium CAVE-383]
MFAIFTIVIPVFALIAAGFCCRRMNVFGATAAAELNRFVVYLALPALLFETIATTKWATLNQPGFIAAFGIGVAVVFGATLLLRMRGGRHLADCAIDSLNAAYANVAFIGFPLCFMALGREGLTAAMVATIITVCILFAIAITMIEFSLQHEQSSRQSNRQLLPVLRKVGGSLSRNPLLLAPLLGALWTTGGAPLPDALASMLKLLGAAASPCALVSLGAFLAAGQGKRAEARSSASVLVLLKLVLQPAITWFLAFHVFSMPPAWANAALLLSALPTGTGPYMLAELYRREAAVTSSAILGSTVISLMTLALCLGWIAR